MNYNQTIRNYTWWKDKDNRLFVVARMRYDWDENTPPHVTTIELLELEQEEAREVSWADMCRWTDAGLLKPVN